MSRQILFNNATAVPYEESPSSGSLITKPTDVPDGRIMAFDADNFADGPLPLDEPTEAKQVVFVQGAKTGEDPIMTSLIDREDVVDVKRVNYVAPVQQVTTVTAATIADGFATVKVIEVSAGYKPHKRVTATVKANGLSTAQLATALANQINAQSPKFVVATTSTANLILTGAVGVSFETALDDDAAGWTIAATTTPNFGTGTYLHVKHREEEAWGQQANFLNRTYLPVIPPSYADSSKTYDLITLRVKTNTTRNIGGLAQKHQEITFAVEATGTGIDLEEFFFGVESPDSD